MSSYVRPKVYDLSMETYIIDNWPYAQITMLSEFATGDTIHKTIYKLSR